jgi:hypothetical protein
MRLPSLLFILYLISPAPSMAAEGQAATSDTTVEGRSYRLVSMAEFLGRIGEVDVDTVRLEHAVISGPLFSAHLGSGPVTPVIDLTDVRFTDPVALAGATFDRAVRFEETVFEQGLSMQGTRFRQAVGFTGIRTSRFINCKRAVFDDSVAFSSSHLAGVSSFVEARFNGSAAFDRVEFKANAFFESARFLAAVDFSDAQFEDITSFKEADWSDRVSFAGARFKKRADFTRTRFRGRTRFDEAMVSELAFDNAEFDDEVSFRRLTFIHPAHFSAAIFRHRVTFAGSLFMHDADFSNSRFDRVLELNAHFNRHLDLRHASGPHLELLPPSPENSVIRRPDLFAPDARVMLQNAVFDKTFVLWRQLAGHLSADPEAANRLTDLQPVYDRLRQQFANQGLREDASACLVEWQELRLASASWRDGEWYWLQLLRLTTYFGTDLWQFARFAAVCVLIFAILLRLAERTGQCSFVRCLSISALTFLRLMPGGQNRRQQILLIAEAVLSWVCWGLFVATAVGRFL